MTKTSPAARRRITSLVIGLLVGAGCSGASVAERRGGSGAGEKALAARLQQADAKLPRPRRLPTISPLDFSAFPDDKKGTYGRSGRRLEIRPGRPGVVAAALARAEPGDTVLLSGGTYREGAPDDDVALRLSKRGVVLRAMPGQRARIVPSGPAVKRGMLIEASSVLVHGLDLEGFPSMGIGMGREGQAVSGIVLSDLTIRFKETGQWTDGIVAWPDNRGSGQPAVDGLLVRNVVVEGATLGISCNSGPCRSWWLENVRVRCFSGAGSGADAVAVESGENIVLVNVETSGATADGIDLKASKVLVMGCHVHHVKRNGVKLWNGGDVVNTVVHHTGADASFVFEKGRYRVLHSILAFHNYPAPTSYSLTAGHGLDKDVRVDLVNSIFYKTSGGMYFSDRTRLRVEGCIFFDMKNNNVLRARARGREIEILTTSPASAFERAGLGKGNLIADPRFTRPDKGDFRPTPSSPAIDHGVRADPPPPSDRAGNPRVRGRAPDIGAYEVR